MSVPPSQLPGSVFRRNVYGPVLMWAGAWIGTGSYVPGDVVTSGGNVYLCILQSTNNQPPNTTYWQAL